MHNFIGVIQNKETMHLLTELSIIPLLSRNAFSACSRYKQYSKIVEEDVFLTQIVAATKTVRTEIVLSSS